MASQNVRRGRASARPRSRLNVAALGTIFLLAIASWTHCGQAFTGNFTATIRQLSASIGVPTTSVTEQGRGSATARFAFDWDTDVRPTVPASADEMTSQAADAIMRAYRDGYQGQAVRLRIELEFAFERLYGEEIDALVNETTPMIKSFTKKLWGGKSLNEVKVSPLDEDGTTLFYREAENARQDAAAIYLPTRQTVASWRTQAFLNEMKDRLVVMVNPESSVAGWSVEARGLDFAPEFQQKQGEAICKAFNMQSYYYYRTLFFNWQVVFYRCYPYDWEVYVESLDYVLIKVGESATKPGGPQVKEWLEAYEADNNISVAQKVGKTLKDFQPSEGIDLPKLF